MGLPGDLQALTRLSPEAQRHVGEALRPNVGAQVGVASQRALERFCEAYEADPDVVIVFIRAARALIREAARLDLPSQAVYDDVVAMTAERDLARHVAACYEDVQLALRGERVLATLERFGPVLQDIALRIDHVPLSRHHPGRTYPIAMLSLPYREGGHDKAVTVQVTPALLHKLRAMLQATQAGEG